MQLPGAKIRMTVQPEHLFHRTVDQPRLEGVWKDHLAQPFVCQGA